MAYTDPYGVLGVDPSAGHEAVRAAYRRLAAQFHPDVNPSTREAAERRMKEINAAYAVIRMTRRQRLYAQRRQRAAESAQVNDPYDPMSGPADPPPPPMSGDDHIAQERFRRRYMEPGEGYTPNRWSASRDQPDPRPRPWLRPRVTVAWIYAAVAAGLVAVALESAVAQLALYATVSLGALAIVTSLLAARRLLKGSQADGTRRGIHG